MVFVFLYIAEISAFNVLCHSGFYPLWHCTKILIFSRKQGVFSKNDASEAMCIIFDYSQKGCKYSRMLGYYYVIDVVFAAHRI